MCDLICILCLVKCDQPAADEKCDKHANGQHDWCSWNNTQAGAEALARRDHPLSLEPRPRQIPVCECGASVRLVSRNSSTTSIFKINDKREELVTEKTNYQCYTCHAHITFSRDSSDDPNGWIGS